MNDYETFLRSQQLNDKTIYAYLGALKKFQLWFENTTGQTFSADRLNVNDPSQFRMYLLHTEKLTPKTINKILAAVRKWLEMNRRTGNWPYEIRLPDVKEQKKLRAPKWLEPKDVAAILFALEQEKNDFLRARDRCFIFLELYRGIRVGECIELLMEDVVLTPGKQKIIIRQGKGGKYDEIDINGSRKILGAIQEWIEVRSRGKFASSPYFFISFRSGKVSVQAVKRMVDRIRERSHVDFTTHQLRHTFIHSFEKISGNLRLTHEVARHSNVNTTLLYTQPSQKEIHALYRILEEST